MTGYGSSDKPVPWLGPQKWIKEVHWPMDRSIIVRPSILFSTSTFEFNSVTCTATLTAPNSAIGFIRNSLIYYQPPTGWPTADEVDTDPGLGINIPASWYPPPRIGEGRTARAGEDNPNGDNTDRIREDEVEIVSMPELKPSGSNATSYDQWQVFSHGFVVVEPTGPLMDFRPLSNTSPSQRFREGTDLQITVYQIRYISGPACYGGFVGDPTGNMAGILNSFAMQWPGDWLEGPSLSIEFGGSRFRYKDRLYKPVGRYIQGPYGTNQPNSTGNLGIELLCQVTDDNDIPE